MLKSEIPWPFSYPSKPIDPRRHGPKGLTNYKSYKPWLRDEFLFRCIYCLWREQWDRTGHRSFGADHLIPQSVAPKKAADYDNLAYACNNCNSIRRDAVLPIDVKKQRLNDHLRLELNGEYKWKTKSGQSLIDLLFLNDPPLPTHRRRVLHAFARAVGKMPGVTNDDFEAFQYPINLDDLSLLRPPANTRTAGIKKCAFARQQNGKLPRFY